MLTAVSPRANGKLLTTKFQNMKSKIVIILVTVLSSHFCMAQANVDSSRIVRVLSFNILHGATTRGDFNLDLIAKVIKDSRADFVAMQEVDYRTKRARKYDLVTELGWRTQMVPLFAKAMSYDGGEYGEGVLSRYTLLESRNVALPYTSGNEPRAAAEISIVLNSGDTISFVGTHLDHLENEKDRLAQAKKINEVFSTNKYPTILAGDLNSIPGSKTINTLEKMWRSSYDKKDIKFTYPSDNPIKKIDYVMFYPKNRWRVLKTEVIHNSIASDHCAYLVTLELLTVK